MSTEGKSSLYAVLVRLPSGKNKEGKKEKIFTANTDWYAMFPRSLLEEHKIYLNGGEREWDQV